METHTDLIIEKLIVKDMDGLDLLIDEFGLAIVKTIHIVLNRPEEKNEVTETENEVFYKIWENIEKFDETKSSFKTWVCTIAKRKAIDKKRQLIRQGIILPIEERLNDLFENDETIVERDSFLEWLEILNEEDQLIFMKYYVLNDGAKEIADDLSLPLEVVYNRLSRGKKRIRTQGKTGGEKL